MLRLKCLNLNHNTDLQIDNAKIFKTFLFSSYYFPASEVLTYVSANKPLNIWEPLDKMKASMQLRNMSKFSQKPQQKIHPNNVT